ncbi:MAG TPA: 5'/3'-nucleotidase SurE [Candidatus Dormibacteraeota bacterium]|jgi:5'-nucleotidase|nr:5'/3'-nucleotidase SurE [Candidatus Dormibacteraeota bacterium]
MKRPRILLTNDDGIGSEGLAAAYVALCRIGEVVVVAPHTERSAMGHAITVLDPLRINEFQNQALSGYAVSGTPADCVKLAFGTILDQPPDLVVSGINLGPNTASHVLYSGTVSAATEARILGVPAMAVSLGTHRGPSWDAAAEATAKIAQAVLRHGLPDRVLLNVNVPSLPRHEIAGLKITRQGRSRFAEDIVRGHDPRGTPYYWLAGEYQMTDDDPQTDAWALQHGYISVTPLSFDLTADGAIPEISKWVL